MTLPRPNISPCTFKIQYPSASDWPRGETLSTLPAETLGQICSNIGDERAFARLAQTCMRLHASTEEYRFREVRIGSPRALTSFCMALSSPVRDRRQRTRSQRMRSLALSWVSSGSLTGEEIANLAWLLQNISHVEELTFSLPPPSMAILASLEGKHHRPSLAALQSLRSMTISSQSALFFVRPCPSTTTLTITQAHGQDLGCLYAKVSDLFGRTLKSLRIFRTFTAFYGRESPIRVCAALQMPHLEYLEIRDMAHVPRKHIDLGRLDFVHRDRMLAMAASDGTPMLQRLVWAPTWVETLACYPKALEWTLRAFQSDLLGALEPITIYVCVAPGLGRMAWTEEPSGGSKFDLAEVPVSDEWWRTGEEQKRV